MGHKKRNISTRMSSAAVYLPTLLIIENNSQFEVFRLKLSTITKKDNRSRCNMVSYTSIELGPALVRYDGSSRLNATRLRKKNANLIEPDHPFFRLVGVGGPITADRGRLVLINL
ncbi:hypothetical protein OUZ56_006070 [Daphnia magna]|uniref:Uncharacterized protein n=1 Tax=Daphnia magna TaxID=35525 RepID=A0ABQ9YUK5_9CRUS|nr:hypothetical protein OUZ56_006070 [Daphnia magna]